MCWQTGAVERLFVIPRWRNKGLGKFLITKGFEYHIKNGRNEIYTMINSQDKEAMLLLESMGYTFSVRMELKALYLLQEVGILTYDKAHIDLIRALFSDLVSAKDK